MLEKEIGFEDKLWKAADKLRNNMDAAEYKHVVLGLIFLKYITDAFNDLHKRLLAQAGQGADPEDPDEYRAENVFWVPKEARWEYLQKNAKQPEIERSIGLIEDPQVDCSGPIWVRGGILVFSADGKAYQTRNRVTLCRCGKSTNKPFCDSSHFPEHRYEEMVSRKQSK